MGQTLSDGSRASHAASQSQRAAILRTRLMSWLRQVRDRLAPTEYVNAADLPDEPLSPYRARLTVQKEQAPDDFETGEREVVAGEMKIIYQVRCACGKRWFNPRCENVQLCPRCGRAVLLRDPA